MGYLVIRGKETEKVHISEISNLIIESTAVSMTAYLLNELVNQKVNVLFCDDKRNPSFQLHSLYGSHDTSQKLREQVLWSKELKASVWTVIVTEKIRKQKELLEKQGKKESLMLDGYIDEIEFGDETNREGHAAKVYFNALFGKQFVRSDDTPINAALNYGYSILLSICNREIVSNGYLTQFGLFHDNMFNQYNLGSDLMEPFRPLVDELVLKISPDKFEIEEKRDILTILDKGVGINGREELVPNALKVYVKSVFDALNASDISLIRFYKNEL